MAAQYPTNVPYDVDNEMQRPNHVHINPYHQTYYDDEEPPERIDSAMDRTAQYVSGLHPNGDPYSTDDQNYHHGHSPHTLPPLTIRRHPPGSNDPTLQAFPTSLQPSVSDNISSSSNLHVTIKRNTISPDHSVVQPIFQPVIQPVLYPVAVYINSPDLQIPNNQPIREIPKPPSPRKAILPVKSSPPLQRKPVSPIKMSPTPPMSPNRFETESFQSPPSRNNNMNTSTRRPVRMDLVPPTPPPMQPHRIRSGKVVVEEFDDFEEQYRVPSIYSVPEKVISYRTAPGMTTRELENENMDHSRKPLNVKSPPVQTVTYRS